MFWVPPLSGRTSSNGPPGSPWASIQPPSTPKSSTSGSISTVTYRRLTVMHLH